VNFFALDLPIYPGEYAEADIIKALSEAVDGNKQPICTVKRGMNAEILDAMIEHPLPEMCPLVMMQVWTEQEVSSMGGGRYYTPYMVSLYCMYYYGNLSTDTSYDPDKLSFTKQRRRHLQAIKAATVMQTGGNTNAPIPVSPHWKWDTTRQDTIDFTSPFRYFGNGYQAKEGYNCVRVDRPIAIYQ
jgi:hypothetical protein